MCIYIHYIYIYIIYIYVCVCMYIYIYVCIDLYLTHAHTHNLTQTHRCVYIYIHIYIYGIVLPRNSMSDVYPPIHATVVGSTQHFQLRQITSSVLNPVRVLGHATFHSQSSPQVQEELEVNCQSTEVAREFQDCPRSCRTRAIRSKF